MSHLSMNYAPGLLAEKTFTMEFYYIDLCKVASPVENLSHWDFSDLYEDVCKSLDLPTWFVMDDFGNAVEVDGFYYGWSGIQHYSIH